MDSQTFFQILSQVKKEFSEDISEADVIIDFSTAKAVPALLTFSKEKNIPVVLCTTALSDETTELMKETSKDVAVLKSANMSVGVNLLLDLVQRAATILAESGFDIEIVEKHHNQKIDAPSGTALMLANAICEVRPEAYANCGRSGQGKRTREEIGIHAIRMGNIVGEHEVMIGTPNQTITLKHEAHSRALFAEGALAAAAFLCGCEAGMYDMKSLVSGAKIPQKV